MWANLPASWIGLCEDGTQQSAAGIQPGNARRRFAQMNADRKTEEQELNAKDTKEH